MGGIPGGIMSTEARSIMEKQLGLKPLDEIVAELYLILIALSWFHADTFELYQGAWEALARVLKVDDFEWSKGQRPHSKLGQEYTRD